ncbi:hypothetical protein [Nocardia sp. NPDC020380]|uniref:hypothetical protein n=1 Tax=Nocardia sp. NPDC020380 TaxID=3364309 RepID=UPI0037A4E965
MSAAQTVLEYIDTLRWPVLGGGLALYYRGSIVQLLGRVEKITAKAGPAEIDLEARKLEKDAKETRAQIESAAPAAGGQAVLSLAPQQRQRMEQSVKALQKFAQPEEDPVPAIMDAPAAASRTTFRQWDDLIRDVRAQMAPSNFWGEAPGRMLLNWSNLSRFAADMLDAPKSITALSAYEFDKAVRAWTRQFAEFLQAALDGAAASPDS